MKQKMYLMLTYICLLFINVNLLHVASASISLDDVEKILMNAQPIQLNTNTEYADCPIVIFYEMHDDKLPASTIRGLLPFLKENGFKIYASEAPYDESLHDFITNLNKLKDEYKYVLNDRKLLHGSWELQKEASSNKEMTLQAFKQDILSYIASFQETIKLAEELPRAGFEYIAVDLSRNQRGDIEYETSDHSMLERDPFIIQKIVDACNKYKTGIIFLVGSAHYLIEIKLKNEGFNVTSIYLASEEPEIDTTVGYPDSHTDVILRNYDVGYHNMNTGEEYRTNVLDLYRSPEIDAISESREIISQFLNNRLLEKVVVHEDL